MGLTRSYLKGMGLTEEQVSSVIEEHISVVNGLKDEISKYKEDAEKYPAVRKELDELKKNTTDWKERYDSEHKAFEEYKTEQVTKETTEKMRTAYRKLLLDAKVGEKHIDSILRVTDFSTMKLKGDGTFDDEKKLVKDIETAWSGFITTAGAKGANVETPPTNTGSKVLTKDEIMKIKDTSERQRAWVDFLNNKGAN